MRIADLTQNPRNVFYHRNNFLSRPEKKALSKHKFELEPNGLKVQIFQ